MTQRPCYIQAHAHQVLPSAAAAHRRVHRKGSQQKPLLATNVNGRKTNTTDHPPRVAFTREGNEAKLLDGFNALAQTICRFHITTRTKTQFMKCINFGAVFRRFREDIEQHGHYFRNGNQRRSRKAAMPSSLLSRLKETWCAQPCTEAVCASGTTSSSQCALSGHRPFLICAYHKNCAPFEVAGLKAPVYKNHCFFPFSTTTCRSVSHSIHWWPSKGLAAPRLHRLTSPPTNCSHPSSGQAIKTEEIGHGIA